jgi:hypothetical protein
MKQYAARGKVERSGSTWVMRKSRKLPCHNLVKRREEDTGVGRAPSVAFSAAGEDMLRPPQ